MTITDLVADALRCKRWKPVSEPNTPWEDLTEAQQERWRAEAEGLLLALAAEHLNVQAIEDPPSAPSITSAHCGGCGDLHITLFGPGECVIAKAVMSPEAALPFLCEATDHVLEGAKIVEAGGGHQRGHKH